MSPNTLESGAVTIDRRKTLKRELKLARYVRPHLWGLAVLLFVMLAEVGLQVARPWPLKLVIDNVLSANAIPHIVTVLPGADTRSGLLPWAVGAEVVIFLLATFASMAYTFSSLRLGQRITYELAGDVFRHLQRQSLLFHSRRRLGDMMERVTGDSYCISTILLEAAVPTLQALVTLGAMFFVMWNLQPLLTLLVIRTLSRPIQERTREQRDLEGGMMSVVEQTLSAMPAIQAFTREEFEHRRF